MAINAPEFLNALEEIEREKGISKQTVITALQEAMVKGYRRQLGGDDADVRVIIDAEKGYINMYQVKKVVKEVEDDFLEVSVEEANELDPKGKYKDGDEFFIEANVTELKKATVMSIKSIMKQKFVEVEKGILYEHFKDKINTMITGKVEKVDDRGGCSVNIGRTSVYLPKNQMIGDERFNNGDSIRLFVSDVASGSKGAHIVVSRANEGFLNCLFNEEIREIYDGSITIKAIAREAGERSKVAVFTNELNVDAAGACIGPNGSRIQKIVSQLGNGNAKEKIDIITYSDISGLYVMDALKPAEALGVVINDETKEATVVVSDDSLSLAIGKKGVNVRLAVRLTGYKIDIKTESVALEEGFVYQSRAELELLREEQLKKLEIQKLSALAEETKLPNFQDGYVSPLERKYEESEESDEELNESLYIESEKEPVTPTVSEEKEVEEKIEEEPVRVEEPVKEEKVEELKEVNTTTTLSDLEKNLEQSAQKSKKNVSKKSSHKKKEEEEEEQGASVVSTLDPSKYMSIYSEEELKAMEEEEQEAEEDDYDEDIDYDDYDEYYDDEDR